MTPAAATRAPFVPPRPDESGPDGFEALDAACLGGLLPASAQRALQAAAAAYATDDQAQEHLCQAIALAPEHPAPLIGLYRYYFYRNRLDEALAVGLRCLALAARANALACDWRAVAACDADFASLRALPRFYLFTLKACTYLHLRLGQLEAGAAMLEKLLELDPGDGVNGTLLRDVLARHGRDDDE